MEDDAPVIYGLEFQTCHAWPHAPVPRAPVPGSELVHFPPQARALTPQTAETDAIRFLVGTQSLKYDNQVTIFDKCSDGFGGLGQEMSSQSLLLLWILYSLLLNPRWSQVSDSDGKIHIIDFDDENNIINKNVLLHQVGEIWHISASPADKGVLATCYSKTAGLGRGILSPYQALLASSWPLLLLPL
ncbi:EARP and GARP complex-interacting protein 1 [Galemys pyrenaicus]|uniref:EARP and GARP complex-interacting protein 1 n=1 Tax=Galemys pyrenaicus TaxID=202257 RepID=A0A8J6DL35_GALPY|nr:EARP and GARP complex-interacting protein 1 [Galemys pyrenaicus]